MEYSKGKWKTAVVKCRICGYAHVAVYPADIEDEDNQECSNCGNMAAQPKEDDEWWKK